MLAWASLAARDRPEALEIANAEKITPENLDFLQN
jgi:hypothetical protein